MKPEDIKSLAEYVGKTVSSLMPDDASFVLVIRDKNGSLVARSDMINSLALDLLEVAVEAYKMKRGVSTN